MLHYQNDIGGPPPSPPLPPPPPGFESRTTPQYMYSGQTGYANEAAEARQPLTANCQEEPIGEGEIPLEAAAATVDFAEAVVTPSAPPISEMERIPGYDEILLPTVEFVAPPPSYHEATSSGIIENFVTGNRLTEEEARRLLVALAKSHCCWGKGAAEGMRFRSIEQSTAVHYLLSTFLETRSTDWASEPFKGQPIDGPINGTPPAPWEIQVQTPHMFHDTVIRQEVPHTASVRRCHNCAGNGRVQCKSCSGWGRNRCYSCHGTGETGLQDDRSRCVTCDGRGFRRCERCHGRGRISCPVCDTAGQVKNFVKLTVAFKTHVRDFILERTPLPCHLIRNVPGKTLLEDTQPLLNPVQTYPEQEVNSQSASIVQEHRALAQIGRIWMQRHVIRGVPVFQCDCSWKDKEFQFFVYGDNKMVYSSDYPQTCCCGCQLL